LADINLIDSDSKQNALHPQILSLVKTTLSKTIPMKVCNHTQLFLLLFHIFYSLANINSIHSLYYHINSFQKIIYHVKKVKENPVLILMKSQMNLKPGEMFVVEKIPQSPIYRKKDMNLYRKLRK